MSGDTEREWQPCKRCGGKGYEVCSGIHITCGECVPTREEKPCGCGFPNGSLPHSCPVAGYAPSRGVTLSSEEIERIIWGLEDGHDRDAHDEQPKGKMAEDPNGCAACWALALLRGEQP